MVLDKKFDRLKTSQINSDLSGVINFQHSDNLDRSNDFVSDYILEEDLFGVFNQQSAALKNCCDVMHINCQA